MEMTTHPNPALPADVEQFISRLNKWRDRSTFCGVYSQTRGLIDDSVTLLTTQSAALAAANLRAEVFERQYRQACQDHSGVMTALAAARAENGKLRDTLKDLLALVQNTEHWNPKAFHNGVEHNGIDEGDVIAGRMIDAARAALAEGG